MATELATRNGNSDALMEKVVAGGDLAALTPQQRNQFYAQVCESLGLNPLTQPFQYIELNRKLTLYARKDATDQLRALRHVSVQIVSREKVDEVYVVAARATQYAGTPSERSDESIGVVTIAGLKGEALANALMKAETKAKRRVTLSICGLGWLDETEVDTVPSARRVVVADTGEILERAQPSADAADDDRLAKAQAYYQQLVKQAMSQGVEYTPIKQLDGLEAIVSAGKALRHRLGQAAPTQPAGTER